MFYIELKPNSNNKQNRKCLLLLLLLHVYLSVDCMLDRNAVCPNGVAICDEMLHKLN